MNYSLLKFLLALVILMAAMILPRDFLFAMQVSQENAESGIDNSESDRMELKLTPYSVNSYGEGSFYNLNDKLEENQGLLTLMMKSSNAAYINPVRVKSWFENGQFISEGIYFDVNRMDIVNKQMIQIVIELSEMDIAENNFIETEPGILNAEGVTVVNVPVILYARKNTVLYLGLADEDQRPFVENYPDRKDIRSADLVKDKSFFTFDYVPVIITDQKEDTGSGGTFLSRNKFWVMGGAAIIGGGAAALITSLSDGSPTYLPIPPGRP